MNRLHRRWLLAWIALFLTGLCRADEDDYALHFGVHFNVQKQVVEARLRVDQSRTAIDYIDFEAPAEHFSRFKGDGKVQQNDGRLLWTIPRSGGELRWDYTVDSKRGSGYDARFTEKWALLRLDSVFPGSRTRTNKSANVTATLELSGPKNWAMDTRYGRWRGQKHVLPAESDGSYRRPNGWMIAGELGIRRDDIAGRKVAVAAPMGEKIHRLDVLAYLSWTLPELVKVFPDMPPHLLIVSAGKPMWRGGLSGPGSLFLHADRPLISENRTSPILHELVHVASRRRMADGEDWLVEGLAEYYAMVFLKRSGGITQRRFDEAINWQRDWANRKGGKLSEPSRGPNTARAVVKLADLDRRLPGGLDAWIASVPKDKKIDCASLGRFAARTKTVFWGCDIGAG